jgi:hypothetical protein
MSIEVECAFLAVVKISTVQKLTGELILKRILMIGMGGRNKPFLEVKNTS